MSRTWLQQRFENGFAGNFGLVLSLIVLSWVLSLSGVQNLPLIVFAVLLLNLFPEKFGLILSGLSIAGVLFYEGYIVETMVHAQRDLMPAIVSALGVSGSIYIKPMALILFLLTWFGILTFFRQFDKRPLWIPLLFMFFLLLLLKVGGFHGDLLLVGWTYYFLLATAFWNFAYLSLEKNPSNQLGLTLPFWRMIGVISAPIHRGGQYLLRAQAKTEIEWARTRWSGVKLIVWCLLLRYFGFALSDTVFGTKYLGFELPSFNVTNYRWYPLMVYMDLPIPLWQKWVALMTNTTFTLMVNVASYVGMMIAVARLSGFRLFRNTYKPYQASSFHDFFNRLFFYYNEILIHFFFYPSWRRVRKIALPKKVKIFAVIFFTVFVGGQIIHALRISGWLAAVPIERLSLIYLGRMPYFFLLALFAALSVTFKGSKKDRPLAFQLPKAFFYLVLFAVCNAAKVNYKHMRPDLQWDFFISLFGF